MKITLKDGSVKQYGAAMSMIDIAKDISEGLARVATAAEVDGEVVDLRYVLDRDAQVNILTCDTPAGQAAFRHTTSHVLAQAVKRLYPNTKLAIGPSIENGFYYDFDTDVPFTAESLEAIHSEMKKIVKEDLPIERFTMSRADALKWAEESGEPYKKELIEDLPEGEELSFYRQGDFVDLCAGPHLMSTGRIKAIALTSLAGAYWRGDEKNKMLQRIYGTSFPKKSELDEYLAAVEEARKRDHNKIGRELDYFTTADVVGQGLPLLMPRGAKVIQVLQRFVEDEEERRGYLLTKTPYMAKSDLYKLSGHWDHYKDGMFVLGDEEKDDEVYALRPMTCPFQFMIYKARSHSYRDLPLRYGETSILFRNEASGEMHGLTRVRQFTLSEGHLVCTPEQLEEEFRATMDLVKFMMHTLGIEDDVTYRFSKWDPNNKEKYIDQPEAWEQTQNQMRAMLDRLEIDYVEADGEAAFYGPKLDIQTRNVYGKEDTLITVQIDFALAERLDMTYVDKDNQKKRPYIIHRSSIGCYERTLAMLLEKYAGALPTWMAPTQVKLLPISENYVEYAKSVRDALQCAGVRVELDARNEKIGYKIREAQMEKVPYMLVLGEKEQQSGQVAVRSRRDGDLGAMALAAFKQKLLVEIADRVHD